MEDSHQNKVTSYSVHKFMGRATPECYWNYLKSKWMRSYRFNNEFISLIDSDSYYAAYGVYIVSTLLKKDTVVRVAVLTEDPDILLGFSVIENDVLHYVFVHKDYRRIGIARKLIPTPIAWFTHLTKTGMKLWPTRMPEAKFNPFK